MKPSFFNINFLADETTKKERQILLVNVSGKREQKKKFPSKKFMTDFKSNMKSQTFMIHSQQIFFQVKVESKIINII